MANEQNLIPFNMRSEKEQREIRAAGGRASGEKRRQYKTYAELIKMIGNIEVKAPELRKKMEAFGIADDEMTHNVGVIIGQIIAAERGNTNAANYLRDTVGEKPVDKSETVLIPQKPLIDLTDRKKNGE